MEYRCCCGSCRGVFYSRQEVKNLCPYCGLVVSVLGREEIFLHGGECTQNTVRTHGNPVKEYNLGSRISRSDS